MLTPQMKYSKAGQALTQSFESCRLAAYSDNGGIWTIGWGHTRGVSKGLTCLQLQADAWLYEDIGWAEAAVNDAVSVPLTQGEFDALVDFDFNTGALRGSTMLDYLNKGQPQLAANEFEKWDHVNGVEVAGLLRRRLEERQEFLQGSD